MKKLLLILLCLPLLSLGQTIWSEGFSGGIPTTWTNSTVPWQYRGISTSPNYAVGSEGAYASAGNPISSPTATDGFIIFDSDYYDNGGTQGAFGTGMYPIPHNGELMTDMIDLSNYTDVSLKVNSYFRTFQGQAFVAFYVNGVYDSQIQVHSNLAVNQSTDTDAIFTVQVPSNVCSNANVQMQFIFDGTSGFDGYYFWMLDDLELFVTPPYLIEIIDQNHGGWDVGYTSTLGRGMDYTFKPLLQSNANPYMFEMTLANFGANDLNGIQININVEDANGSSVFISNSTPSTLAVLDTESYLANQTFSPTSVGVYNINFWGSADSISSSDTTVMQAVITDTVYGRDNNNPNGAFRVGTSCGGMQLGNKFDIYTSDEITSVSAYVADYSVAGASMFAALYAYDTINYNFVLIDQSNDYIIQSGDINNWVTIDLINPIMVTPGQQYMMAIGGYAHPTDTFGISVSGDSELQTSFIHYTDCSSNIYADWSYIFQIPMIRINFGDVSYDCINNSCIDPGTGNGAYTSLSACLLDSCSIPSFVDTNIEYKNVILEHFNGGITNSFAADGDAKAQTLSNNNPGDVFIITIHEGSYATPQGPGTDFTTSWGAAIQNQSGLVGFPVGTINRHVFPSLSSFSSSLDRADWPAAVVTTLSEISPVNVAAQASLDISTRELTIVVEAYYTGATTNINMLNVGLIQNNIEGPQSGGATYNPTQILTNGNYNHQNMLRHLLTGQWGESIVSTTSGSFYTKTYTYTIPSDLNGVIYDLLDLEVIVFIAEGNQEIITGNIASMNYIFPPTWDCDGQGTCIDPGTGNGTFASLSACQANCVVVSPTWDCDGQGTCIDPGTGNGTFASLSACQANCVVITPTWDCNTVSGCYDPGTGVGTYASLSACQSNCVVVAPTWDCDGQGTCIDPGTGNGTFASLSACQANCVVITPTWDCDGQGTCSNPGTGNGTYASLSACQANCNNVSVEEIGLTNLKIFPNPSSDLFNISFSSNRVQDLIVRVLNSISEEVMIIELNQYKGEYTKQINLNDNAKGIYFLEIETNDGVTNKKLILQ